MKNKKSIKREGSFDIFREKYFLLLAILLIIIASLFIRTTITGFITVSTEYNYSDSVDLVVEDNYEYTWFMGNVGAVKSVRLDGSVSIEGSAKIYLEYENESYLIFDSSRLGEEGIGIITGLVVSNESESIVNQTNNASLNNKSESSTNETSNESEPLGNDSLNKSTENKFSEPYLTSLNKTIIITTQGGGSKSVNDIFEFNVIGGFNWGVDYSKVCTKWEVNSEVVECYGSSECCAFLGIESSGSWDDSFYLSYGRYDSGLENDISVQIIYYDVDLTVPYSDIVYSSEEGMESDFYGRIIFRDLCIDTCLLPGFNATSYKLRFVIENASLTVDSIRYSIEEEINISRNAPELIKEFEDITIYKNENKTINLSQYFTDPDGDVLTYSYYNVEDITILIEDDTATIIPDSGFAGKRYTFFTANDSLLTAVSNVFTINVSEFEVEGLEQLKAEIGKPVKWIKRSRNKTILVPDYAFNISINKIINDRRIELESNKIKIKYKGKVKNLDEFEIDKELERLYNLLEKAKGKGARRVFQERIDKLLELKQSFVSEEADDNETALVVNETADSYEVIYLSEAPISEEVVISPTVKKVTISSEVSYRDVLAYTTIAESPSSAIRLYWYKNDSRIDVTNDAEINLSFIDSNLNSLIDRLEWIVPHLSNQTFEIEITILNVQSYPMVSDNWTVRFNTTGSANLTIRAVNETTFTEIYDNSSTENDLEFLEVKCGDSVVNVSVVLEDGTVVPYDIYLKIKRIREIDEVLK